jgi:carbonic anhydrase
MTCPNATAPVNIINNQNNICDLKCEYSFDYTQTSLNVFNKGEYLSLKPDKSNTPPVIYNANKYDVQEMRLYKPSLHAYNGKKADAELIVIHNNVSGIASGNLLVCVPIEKNASTSNPDSLSLFDKIISEVKNTAPSKDTETVVNISSFSIDKFIPIKPYFSYSGTLPYSPCNGEHDYVVFSKDNNAVLAISVASYNTLNKIITSNGYASNKNKKGVFYNGNGPSPLSGSIKGDIYMECLPTGSDGEQLVPLEQTSTQMFNTESFLQFFKSGSLVFQILLGLCLFIILWKLFSLLISSFKSSRETSGGGANPLMGGANPLIGGANPLMGGGALNTIKSHLRNRLVTHRVTALK